MGEYSKLFELQCLFIESLINLRVLNPIFLNSSIFETSNLFNNSMNFLFN